MIGREVPLEEESSPAGGSPALRGLPGRYLLVAALASGLAGTCRALARFATGLTPAAYLPHTAALNAGLLLSLSLVCLPVVLAARRRMTRRSVSRSVGEGVAVATGLLVAYVAFWGLHSGIGPRALSGVLDGRVRRVAVELANWMPGVLLFPSSGLAFVRLRPRVAAGGALVLLALSTALSSVSSRPASAGSVALSRPAQHRPSVFVIVVDTLRADHLPLYGYPLPTTTHLDRLAEDGTVFTRAFAHAPWTRPSCATLLTSRLPDEIWMGRVDSVLPRSIPTLAQHLRAEGYRTVAILSTLQLSPQFGFGRGFDEMDMGAVHLAYTGLRLPLSRVGLIDGRDLYPRYDARQVTDRALGWLAGRSRDEPVFMYLHYTDPHAPYLPPAGEDRWREFAGREAAALDEPPFSPAVGGPHRGVAREALVARYDAEIAFFDRHLGRFLDYLRSEDLYDEALVVLTADHGEEFDEHGGFGHGHSLYNELLYVPLVVKYPTRLSDANGRRVPFPRGLVDVVPTVSEVLGAHWPAGSFRGRSLLRDEREGEPIAVYSVASSEELAHRTGSPEGCAVWFSGRES